VLQVATVQMPPAHPVVALGRMQTLLHAPQLFGSVAESMLQPVEHLPSQLRKGGMHGLNTQLPMKHIPHDPHKLPHVPQFIASARTLISQPLATTPSQLAKPVLHCPTAQLPPVHAGVAFGMKHIVPQPPQLPVSVCVFTSHPLDAIWSQFA
jgi:hypothetical protein